MKKMLTFWTMLKKYRKTFSGLGMGLLLLFLSAGGYILYFQPNVFFYFGKSIVGTDYRFNPPHCGWDDDINGNCDSKGYVLLTKEEIEGIMKKKHATREEVLAQVAKEIERKQSWINMKKERKDEIFQSDYDQLNRLNSVRDILIQDN